jgi:3-phenylpropionate/cinnamic acid dioxygenase small subunit
MVGASNIGYANKWERDAMDNQLRELLDREEITRLVYRLSAVLDEGRFEELPSIFTEDAAAQTPGGQAEGRDAVIAQAVRNHSPEDRIQHLLSNVLIEVAGDHAGVRANVLATFATAAPEARLGPTPRFALGGIYRFNATRTPQGWRLSRVETHPIWASGDVPRRPSSRVLK